MRTLIVGAPVVFAWPLGGIERFRLGFALLWVRLEYADGETIGWAFDVG